MVQCLLHPFIQEHHLQRALSAQQCYGTAEALVIPVPEIVNVNEKYQKLYGVGPEGYKVPKPYIRVQREHFLIINFFFQKQDIYDKLVTLVG